MDSIKNILWGSFGAVHIISLLLAFGIIAGLYFLLRNLPKKAQTAIMGILSFSGIGAVIFNLSVWGSPFEYLPLHLCSLNAIVLPIAVFTRSKRLNNLLLLWAFGAAAALVLNFAQANYEIFSWTFAFYYFPHLLELGIPILMFLLKHVEKDVRCIISTIAITVAVYVLVHLSNVGLNTYFRENGILTPSGNVVHVNYMYSISPENPFLKMLYGFLLRPFWYMFLALPIIAVYLCVIYLPQILKIRKKYTQTLKRKSANNAAH